MKKLLYLVWICVSCLQVTAQNNNGKKTNATLLTDWLDLHCKMVRAAKGIPHVAYSRHFLYSSVAAYESVIPSHPSYRSLSGQVTGLTNLPSAPKENFFAPASLNAAYADMLRKFYGSFGSCLATIDSMEAVQLQRFNNMKVKTESIDKSVAFGKAIASSILSWANLDGADIKKEYKPLTGEGVWIPSPDAAVPFWSETRSMTKDLLNVATITSPTYSAEKQQSFYKMADEVYQVSVNLTPEQKATALYWDDSPNGRYKTVFGHWASILSGLIKSNNASLIKAVEAYAKMAIAMHEASLLVWKAKYQYNVVRPVTFIRQYINKDWSSLIGTPPHPEFPAAHATLSYAAATALTSSFGQSAVTDNSYVDIGMNERKYNSILEAAREAGMSRLYGGIHYRHSIEQGFLLGEQATLHTEKNIRWLK